MHDIVVNGRSMRVVLPLAPENLMLIKLPNEKRTRLRIQIHGRMIVAEIATKSLRKAIAVIAEHGADGVAAFVQGKLAPGNIVEEAGLIAQPKGQKVSTPEPVV